MTLALANEPAKTPADEHVLFAFKKRAPQLDGVLAGDDAWTETQAAVDFLVLGSNKPAENQTEVRVVWDDEAMYFGLDARLPSGSKPVVENKDPWNNDSIELWIGTPKPNAAWYQFVIDAAGQIVCSLDRDASRTPVEGAWRVSVKPSDNGWRAEIAIPFAALGIQAPENGATLGFGAHRSDPSVASRQLSSWAQLTGFNQTSRFGKLVFSSDWEVLPQLSYWNAKRDQEALLRRQRVSAREIFASGDGAPADYTLWKYDPISITADRRKRHGQLGTNGLFGDNIYWSGYKSYEDVAPAFYSAAVRINKAMVALSFSEDLAKQAARAAFYAGQRGLEAKSAQAADFSQIRGGLDAIYASYGRAFDDTWNVSALEGIEGRLDALDKSIAEASRNSSDGLTAQQAQLRAHVSWPAPNFRFGAKEESRDPSGTLNRIHHTLYASYPYQVPIKSWWSDWDSVNIDWTRAVPESDSIDTFRFPQMQRYVDFIQRMAPGTKVSYHMLFGSYYAMPYPEWLRKLAEKDPDMLITSADGLQVAPRQVGAAVPLNDGMNINHPVVQDYARQSVGALAGAFGNQTAYVVAGWEDNNILHLPDNKVAEGARTAGYNVTGRKAFQDYLAKRYSSIAELNQQWKSNYASFQAIEPPPDKWLEPARQASGLTHEWERFIRWNHFQYSRLLRDAYRGAAPQTPVMIDDSHFLADGNLYSVFKENAADIVSFHWTPQNEEAMWAMVNRMCERFGKTAGYYENYSPMYTNRAQGDENQALAATREVFWRIFVHGNRYLAWWIKPHTGPSEYAAAYGGGTFGLDFDQTILRWSMSVMPVLFERGRQIEKAFVKTKPEPTRTAVLQSDATVMNLSARGMRVARGFPPITGYITLHNEFFGPGGYALDFLTEEMLLDGKAKLEEFDTLILIHGFWMDPRSSGLLKEWITKGGKLIAIGPCAIYNPFGQPLSKEDSVFLTAFKDVEVTGRDLWSVKVPGLNSSDVIVEQPLGNGSVVFVRQSLEKLLQTEAGRKEIADLLARSIPRRAVADSPQIKLASRVADDGSVFLFPVNTSLEKPVQANITVQGDYAQAVDIVIPGGMPVELKPAGKEQTFPLVLAPGDWTSIQLLPKK